MDINDKTREYAARRLSEAKPTDMLGLDSKQISKAYKDGMNDAFRMIEHEIDMCTVRRYQFPILHVRDFIDTMLGRKGKKQEGR